MLEDVAVHQDGFRLAFKLCHMISAALDCDSVKEFQHGAGKQLFKMSEACKIQMELGSSRSVPEELVALKDSQDCNIHYFSPEPMSAPSLPSRRTS